MQPVRAGLIAAAVVLIVSSCGHPPYSSADSPTAAALQQRAASADVLRPHESITDLLGNVEFSFGDRPAQPLTEAVVVASVIAVDRRRGHVFPEDGSPERIEVAFDDRQVQAYTVHVTVGVSEVVTGHVDGDRLTFGVAFSGGTSYDVIAQDFMAMPSLVLFLTRSAVLDYDQTLYALVEGSLFGIVDDDGRVDFPMLEAGVADALGAEGVTVAALRAAAQRDPVVKAYPSG